MALPSTALVPAAPARGAGKMPTDGGEYSLRDGWWHCDMCEKWAWGSHVYSDRHLGYLADHLEANPSAAPNASPAAAAAASAVACPFGHWAPPSKAPPPGPPPGDAPDGPADQPPPGPPSATMRFEALVATRRFPGPRNPPLW